MSDFSAFPRDLGPCDCGPRTVSARSARVAAIRESIAAGTYETPARWERAWSRFLAVHELGDDVSQQDTKKLSGREMRARDI